ncbi:hypothetical protein SAMN05443247_01557 [Bradyrhizobium erythrophlei]|nr:hypothetical protein SAMN05443247_01557 [Bradyrhizobium erythrophlei]
MGANFLRRRNETSTPSQFGRGSRHCERSEAIHLSASGGMDCFVAGAPRNDDQTHLRIPAARFARALQIVSPRNEGAGNAGCTLHPRSRVQNCAKKTHTSIQVQRRRSGIPCAMALRLMPCSPRRRIRLVTVAADLTAIPIRLDRCRHRQLDTSNGCQDHTVLPYASAPFVWRAGCSLTD